MRTILGSGTLFGRGLYWSWYGIYAGRKKLENTAIIESQHSSGGNSGIMLPENGKKIGMMKTHPFKVFSRKKPNWGQLLHLFLAFIS